MAKLYFDIEQGSAAWFKLRSGIPTAGSFHNIITPAKMQISAQRFPYACRLIAERLLNWQSESLDHVKHIEAGKRLEPFAVRQLEFTAELETVPIGLVTTNDGRFGASPDRISGRHESSVEVVIECKCPTIPTQLNYLLFGHDAAYKPQVQGQLWVAEAEEALFYSFLDRGPAYMVRTHRDEAFIRAMKNALEQFSDELDGWTEKARSLGVWQAFAEVATPADAERGAQLRNAPLASEEEMAALIEQDMGRGEWHRAGA
jgi:hypothetical protein